MISRQRTSAAAAFMLPVSTCASRTPDAGVFEDLSGEAGGRCYCLQAGNQVRAQHAPAIFRGSWGEMRQRAGQLRRRRAGAASGGSRAAEVTGRPPPCLASPRQVEPEQALHGGPPENPRMTTSGGPLDSSSPWPSVGNLGEAGGGSRGLLLSKINRILGATFPHAPAPSIKGFQRTV